MQINPSFLYYFSAGDKIQWKKSLGISCLEEKKKKVINLWSWDAESILCQFNFIAQNILGGVVSDMGGYVWRQGKNLMADHKNVTNPNNPQPPSTGKLLTSYIIHKGLKIDLGKP